MIVSWNWLSKYVKPSVSMDEVIDKLTMSGLNHEGTESVFGDDFAIDLEVTSNRADCLGHLGVAREVSVLFNEPLEIPEPNPPEGAKKAADTIKIKIESDALCPRYTGRVIRGVKVGPSPAWLQESLGALGINSVNNIVDITNYVMLECGQPLHAFDLKTLSGPEIIVREAKAGEKFEAIDHRTYELEPGMCVIADTSRAIAIGGVMGGADSEVSTATTDLLIEAAEFSSQAIRSTARKLKLHSDASYRFERPIDSHGVDWASRRCCELILEVAGGELLAGVVDSGRAPGDRKVIQFRHPQVKRILGIDVPEAECQQILEALGCEVTSVGSGEIQCIAPTWRSDLTREIDLIEEVARVHGYDRIPEDVAVPMKASHRSSRDRSMISIRHLLTACGFDEAMTASLIPESWEEWFSPWSSEPSLKSLQPMEGVLDRGSQTAGAVKCLRRSLLASLVEARRINEYRGNEAIELFEIAKAYLPQSKSLPAEPTLLGLVSQREFFELKGVLQTLLEHFHVADKLTVEASALDSLDVTKQAQLKLGGVTLGWIGEVSKQARESTNLRRACSLMEINLDVLFERVTLVPQQAKLSPYPSIDRDFNFIVDESVSWADLSETVTQACDDLLEEIAFKEVFRDPKKDGENKKRLLLSIRLRALNETLTGDQADAISQRVITDCDSKHGAKLLG